MKRRRFFLLRLAAASIVAVLATLTLLAADLWAHHRAERTAGVNRRGYRGPLVGAAHVGEQRIVMLGGSTVFGYGVFAREALPAQLERALRTRGVAASVVNLGFNSEGAYAFAPAIGDYAWLNPDLVVLYEGYNDLLPELPNRQLVRHGSIVFRATGYFPILPLVVREKIDALAANGTSSRVVFGGAARAADALTRQIGRLSAAATDAQGQTHSGERPKWAFYCDAVKAAIVAARTAGMRVLVVTQPYISDSHLQQQDALRAMLKQYEGDAGVAYFDAGHVIDLTDRQLAFDGMHLTPQGNAIMANALSNVVEKFAFSHAR